MTAFLTHFWQSLTFAGIALFDIDRVCTMFENIAESMSRPAVVETESDEAER